MLIRIVKPFFSRTSYVNAPETSFLPKQFAAGRVLKHATLDHMWMAVKLGDGTTFRLEKTLGVGLGWLVDDQPGHHSVGGTGGSSGAFRHYRDDRVTVVVLTNLRGIDPDALVEGVAALYVPALAFLNSARN